MRLPQFRTLVVARMPHPARQTEPDRTRSARRTWRNVRIESETTSKAQSVRHSSSRG
jgi:hypothetical protein